MCVQARSIRGPVVIVPTFHRFGLPWASLGLPMVSQGLSGELLRASLVLVRSDPSGVAYGVRPRDHKTSEEGPFYDQWTEADQFLFAFRRTMRTLTPLCTSSYIVNGYREHTPARVHVQR